MAGNPAVDKLRAFLRELKPGARALLITELERGLLQGASPAGAELVLAELRRALREGRTLIARFDDSARLFFQPLEPFLVDDIPEHRHRGTAGAHRARAALALDQQHADAGRRQGLCRAGRSGVAGRRLRPGRACRARFPGSRVAEIQQMLAGAGDRDRGRLTVSLGTSRAVEDVQTLCGILRARDGLAMLGTQLPGHISMFAGSTLDTVKAQFDAALGDEADLFLYALVLLMSRLASPWQLIRLATRAAEQRRHQAHRRNPLCGDHRRRARRDRPPRPRACRRSQERARHRGVGAAQGNPRRAARPAHRDRPAAGIRRGAGSSPSCTPISRGCSRPRSS